MAKQVYKQLQWSADDFDKEIGWDNMDWIDTGQDRDKWLAVVSTVINCQVP